MLKKRRLQINKKIVSITAIVILLSLALIFLLAFKGYSFLSLVLFGIALVIGTYLLLSKKDTRLFKALKRTLTALLILLMIAITVAEIPVIAYSFKREKAASPYCIVLGAGVHGTRPSRILNQRISAAYDFLTEYPDAIAVLSGGQGPGEDITEALCMKEQLMLKGIDESRLYLEEKSTSTYENIKFSKEIIQALSPGTTEVTVISSDTHLYRACLIAKEAGLEAKGYYSHTDYPILKMTYMLREGVAVWKEWLF